MSKPAKKSKVEERVYFDTKYGPLTIHQGGTATKELCASPVSPEKRQDGCTHVLDKMRISLHVERFQGLEPFIEEIKCIIKFPQADRKLSEDATCQMRVGFTHGTAVVSTEPLFLTLPNSVDTVMEIEYFLGEKSLTKLEIPVRLA